MANGSGIVTGLPNGTYDPSGLATRAEAAVMLNRFLKAKGQSPATDQIVNKYKGVKTIHDYTKEELEKWIDKEAYFKRLSKYPVEIINEDISFLRSLTENNRYFLQPEKGLTRTRHYNETRVKVVDEYMEIFFNRDYRTIGDSWIKEIRYYYRGTSRAEVNNLPQFFNGIVKETKDNKTISESIFVTDISLYHNAQRVMEGKTLLPRARGTQYVRYTSGSVLPKGFELNKWYKRDVDVELMFPSNFHWMSYETSMYVYQGIYPITSYVEVKK